MYSENFRTSTRRRKLDILAYLTCLLVANTPTIQAYAQDHAGHHSSVTNALKLDGERKWQSDTHTYLHVKNMKEKLTKLDTQEQPKTIEDLHALGLALSGLKDQLIRGCTMTGAAHDQLHHWLTLIIPSIESLKRADSKETALRIEADLKRQVDEFFKYFESKEVKL